MVDEFKCTAPVIEKQGESLLQVSQQLAADVQGLHAKLERKDLLHVSNEELVQDKLQEFNGQFKQLQLQLDTYRSSFTEASDSLKSQLAAFVVAKNEDMSSAGQIVSDMNTCISAAATAVDKKMKVHSKASDKTSAALTKASVKHGDAAAAAAAEAAAAVAHAGEGTHAALETQNAAVSDMQAAVNAQVNKFQELAAAFVEQQANIVSKLQEAVAQHMAALQSQQLAQQKQIEDMKQQHAAATVSAKARVLEALSQALDAGFTQQTSVVTGTVAAMQATMATAAEASVAAAANISAAAALSTDASSKFVSALAPVADSFNTAAAHLHQQNAATAAEITLHSTAATSAAASAQKSVTAATTKLTDAVATAAADFFAANGKLAGDVEDKLKVCA